MNRNGRIHGVTHATGMNAKSSTPSGASKAPAPSPKIKRSGMASNPQPKNQPGATATGSKHTTY